MKGILLFCVVVGVISSVQILVADDSSKSLEYKIKAGFTCKFVKFVHWPPDVLPKKNTPFIIGILGNDPFGSVIDEAVRELTIRRRKFIIRRYSNLSDLDFCHILFISRSEKDRLDKIFSRLDTMQTLTVSEMDGFCHNGGMINFIVIKNKIRFEINIDAARSAGLEISTQLLLIARVIGSSQSTNN